MPIVQLEENAHESDFPFLKQAGDYGPSCQHEATCTIESYEDPAVDYPAFDKDHERTWAVFHLKIVPEEGRTINESLFMERKHRLYQTLGGLGVTINDDNSYDTDDVAPGMEVIISAKAPRTNKEGVAAYSSITKITPVS